MKNNQVSQSRSITTLSIFITLSLLFLTNPAFADIFAAGKTEITDATGEDSTLYYALQVVGIAFSAWFGIQQKNWFGAIGGFAVFQIFLNFAMGTL